LKTFAALGVYGASVITAVTAQNTVSVRAVHEIPPDMVAAQLDAVLDDFPIAAVKIGMLSSAAIIKTVAERLRAHQVGQVVVDTVLLSSSGNDLLQDNAVQTLIDELFPLATLITPNLPEAARLLRIPAIADVDEAAQKLLQLGPRAVLLKGGHANSDVLEDLLVIQGTNEIYRYSHQCVRTQHTHGTGCTLSAAVAAGLASGLPLPQAVERAIDWLHNAIVHAWPLGHGSGPVHHCWQWWGRTS
jgi:hydroxymethylpyrimidine/phosphomethylpyrimidine kinase